MSIISQIHQETGAPIDGLCDALQVARASYYRHQESRDNASDVARNPPKNALSDVEKQTVLDLLHSERFIDKTPYEAYHAMIDVGAYHCSPRTMYRLLASQSEAVDRRQQRNHRDAVKPELMATRPNEVWTWDITKLLSYQRWQYFYLYVILDIFSRYVVGWMIADCESKELAKKLIHASALKQGVRPGQLTLHADNGSVMTSQTVSQLLMHLGIEKTHNRPYTSNDNPFSESQFKTTKYCPEFPGKFENIKVAEAFGGRFFPWYNTEHYHSGIAWLTPKSVHYGYGQQILLQRHQVLMEAYQRNPARFNNKEPILKQLASAVYINPPQTISIGENALQKEVAVA